MTITSSALVARPGPAPTVDEVRRVRRRTLGLLMLTQVIGGVGLAIGIAVGALLAAAMGGTSVSGFAQSALVVGAALLAVPVTRIMRSAGRRPGLAAAYAVGALGAVVVVLAAARGSVALLFVGLFLFGGGSAAGYQARYTAVDLAEPARRGRQLSWVVWATTVGAVAGPNLAPAADAAVHRFGAATYSGPFVISAVAFLLAALLIIVLLRPDPLLLARRIAASSASGLTAPALDGEPAPGVEPAPGAEPTPGGSGSPTPGGSGSPASGGSGSPAPGPARGAGMATAVREVMASPAARLGIAAVAVGHLVMIGVMSMTPVHIGESGHADTLRVVGIVLSAHIAGMYAISPVTGWLTDRLGRRPVILIGIVFLLGACAVAGTAGHDVARLSLGLIMLGLGWSGTMVAGSTLLSESVGTANKPSVQGLSDLVMGLAGASSGALSGLIVAWSSYTALTMLAAVSTIPLIALALRPARPAMAEG